MFPFDDLRSGALPPAFQAELPGGLRLLVRHVGPDDTPRLQEGFRRISNLARRRHFPGEDLRELGAEQLKLLEQVDQRNYLIWGALNPAQPDEPGVGIARYRRLSDEPESADVAITVLEQYQGTGAGLLLHASLHRAAYANGIRWFYYDVSVENVRFVRHLKKLGAEHVGNVHFVTRLRLPVFPRALKVPQYNASGLKFAQTMRQLARVRPVASAAGAASE